MSTNYNHKIHGSILGSFIGDSIGFLFEGHKQSFIKNYLEKIKNYEIKNYSRGYDGSLNGPIHKDNLNNCKWSFKFGQITDDSQLTFLVIDNILKNNGLFSVKDYGYSILDLFENKHIVGYGSTTKKFTENLSRGVNYKYSGVISNSNGSLMRSDIFGLLFFQKDNDILFDCVEKQSLLTHLNYQTLACCLCSSFTVKYIMNNKNIIDDLLLYDLYLKIKNVNIDVANAILELKNILNYDFQESYNKVKKFETIKWGEEKLSSCALTTLLWALYSFLKNKESFEDCLLTSLMVGGDVDTIAKIACSFSGCYLGVDKLPSKYLISLHDKNKIDYLSIKIKINTLVNLIKENKINYL